MTPPKELARSKAKDAANAAAHNESEQINEWIHSCSHIAAALNDTVDSTWITKR